MAIHHIILHHREQADFRHSDEQITEPPSAIIHGLCMENLKPAISPQLALISAEGYQKNHVKFEQMFLELPTCFIRLMMGKIN